MNVSLNELKQLAWCQNLLIIRAMGTGSCCFSFDRPSSSIRWPVSKEYSWKMPLFQFQNNFDDSIGCSINFSTFCVALHSRQKNTPLSGQIQCAFEVVGQVSVKEGKGLKYHLQCSLR